MLQNTKPCELAVFLKGKTNVEERSLERSGFLTLNLLPIASLTRNNSLNVSISLGYKMSKLRTNKMEEKIEWNFKSSTVSLWYLHHVQSFHSFCVFISAIKLLWPSLGCSNKSLNWYSQTASHQTYPKCSKCPRHSLVPALCSYESRWFIGSKSNMDLLSILKWLSTKVSTLY